MRLSLEYKLEASLKCNLHIFKLVLITLIEGIITSIISYFTASVAPMGALLVMFSSILILGPLNFGVSYVTFEVDNGLNPKLSSLFTGFSLAFKTISLYFLEIIKVFLYSLLLIVPGIMKLYSYKMAYYVMLDNPTLSANACLKKSEEIMKGHRLELFSLEVSYIFSYLLGILTFGIYLIFVIPKIRLAHYLFYKDLVGKKSNLVIIKEDMNNY